MMIYSSNPIVVRSGPLIELNHDSLVAVSINICSIENQNYRNQNIKSCMLNHINIMNYTVSILVD